MRTGENKKNRNKFFICTAFILCALVFVPSFSYSVENKPIVNKTVENKFFIKKIIERKKVKKDSAEIKTIEDKDILNKNSDVVFSIEACVDYALGHNPNIKNYESTQKIQKSAVGQAKSSYFPNLYGGTGYNINNTRYSGDTNNSTNNNNYYGLNLGINQLIWDFGRTTAKINMNKFNYEAFNVGTAIMSRLDWIMGYK